MSLHYAIFHLKIKNNLHTTYHILNPSISVTLKKILANILFPY